MDTICLANTCKGTRCSRKKTSTHYCKIHTSNEICDTCGSDLISSTDSIYKTSGKSMCVPCREIQSAEILVRMKQYADEQRVEHEAKMREINDRLRDSLQKVLESEMRLRETRANAPCLEAIFGKDFARNLVNRTHTHE